MIRSILLLLLFTLITSACSAPVLPMSENAAPPVFTPVGSVTPDRPGLPTQEPIEEDAGGYARAFYNAWENNDYLGMYSLLSPQSQALVDSASFVERYDEAMKTAGVQSIHTQPLSLAQDGDRAEFGIRVTFETAVVGPITREYTIPLVYDDGRWGITWHEGLILPELEGGNRLLMDYQIPSRASIYDTRAKR